MIVDLPYPHPYLWPNGRTRSWRAKAAKVKDHRLWATIAAQAFYGVDRPRYSQEQRFAVRITVHGKQFGPLPDADGVVASVKSYLDGIAPVMGVNDRQFDAPTVRFLSPRNSRFIVEVVAI